MEPAPIPYNEKGRIKAVKELGILDTKPEERFDKLTKEAVEKLKAPISTISIIDSDREWYKSCQGVKDKDGKRDISFCGHALFATNVFVVEDTLKDIRFFNNPTVIGYPFIRFYAGVTLLDQKTRFPIGVFCIKDTKPRKFSLEEIDILTNIAERAEQELNKVKK